MVLIVSGASGVEAFAKAMSGHLDLPVQVAESARRALVLLRGQDFRVVVVDQWLAECDADGVEQVLQQSGMAIPLFVNLAIYSAERVLRETRAALERHERERRAALAAAASTLRSELRSDVTGILLTSQLALAEGSLPDAAQARLKSVCTLAERIRARLEA